MINVRGALLHTSVMRRKENLVNGVIESEERTLAEDTRDIFRGRRLNLGSQDIYAKILTSRITM